MEPLKLLTAILFILATGLFFTGLGFFLYAGTLDDLERVNAGLIGGTLMLLAAVLGVVTAGCFFVLQRRRRI
jgi:drug/metabolite transporter (DMT)-like permease